MSSGPGREKEKPRSASSSCGEETPEVDERAVHAGEPERREHVLRVAEVGAHGAEGLAPAREAGGRGGDRARVLVEPDHARPPFEEELGVTAAAQRPVEQELARRGAQELDDLSREYRSMDEIPAHAARKAASTSLEQLDVSARAAGVDEIADVTARPCGAQPRDRLEERGAGVVQVRHLLEIDDHAAPVVACASRDRGDRRELVLRELAHCRG